MLYNTCKRIVQIQKDITFTAISSVVEVMTWQKQQTQTILSTSDLTINAKLIAGQYARVTKKGSLPTENHFVPRRNFLTVVVPYAALNELINKYAVNNGAVTFD